jgi:hypothetical protein
VRYRLKTAYRDGTTQVVFEPLDFLARLDTLVPPPRVHLTRYPECSPRMQRWARRSRRRGEGGAGVRGGAVERMTPKHVAMSWM